MTEPLHISKKDSIPGLKITCTKCNRQISDTCGETGKNVSTCHYGEYHRFKGVFHKPRTANGRITKNLSADIRDAVTAGQEILRIRKEIQDGTFEKTRAEENKEQETPTKILHVMAKYLASLNGEGDSYYRKVSRHHLKDAERAMNLFIDCMKDNKRNIESMSVKDIGDAEVKMLLRYLLKEKNVGDRSFNRQLFFMTQMIDRYGEEYEPIKNWFKRVPRKEIITDPQSITKEEFDSFLSVITKENGTKRDESGKMRYYYQPWLKHAYRFALITGRRREELIEAKFSDVMYIKGIPKLLRFTDFKVSRAKDRPAHKLKYNYNPLTPELKDLLDELNFEKLKSTDSYILAPEITEQRKIKMIETLSKSFAHYYSQLNQGEKSFGCLRKTNISSLAAASPGDVILITGHSNMSVPNNNYIDPRVVAVAERLRNHQIFPKEDHRMQELEEIRSKSSEQELNPGIEK